MKRLLSLLCGLLSTLGLVACDQMHIQELKPGISTSAEVRERFGVPGEAWHNDDGSVTWEFTRQPEGTECFMITIGPDDVLLSIDQVLHEETFARIRTGMSSDEIRRLLGRPASVQSFESSGQTVWNWRIASDASINDPYFLTVYFDAENRVVKSGRHVEYLN